MPEQMTKKGNALTARPEGAVTTWSPWNEMTDLRRRMDDLFSQAFGYTPLSRLIPAEMAAEEPEVNIHETDTAFQVLASLPGYTPEQIDVQATDNMLTIQGERKPLFDNEKGKTHRSTGVSGSSQFRFAYTLPTEIDPNKIKATFANGVLQLELPKTEQARTKSVKIPIHSGR